MKWLNKAAGEDCVHCQDGCLIHETKEKECRGFEWAWLQSNVDNPELRPDRCGIVFEKTVDDEMFGTVAPDREISDAARKQLQNFVDQGYVVRLTEQV